MLSLLMVLVVLSVVLSVVIVMLFKGNERLKAQYRAYLATVNTVLAEQKQEAKCFRLHAEAFEIESLQKDEEIEKLKEKIVVLEKLAAETAAELEEATASEFALKAKLANVSANYGKAEAYIVSSAKKSNSKEFDNCLFEDDYIMEVEKKLGIHWFK